MTFSNHRYKSTKKGPTPIRTPIQIWRRRRARRWHRVYQPVSAAPQSRTCGQAAGSLNHPAERASRLVVTMELFGTVPVGVPAAELPATGARADDCPAAEPPEDEPPAVRRGTALAPLGGVVEVPAMVGNVAESTTAGPAGSPKSSPGSSLVPPEGGR